MTDLSQFMTDNLRQLVQTAYRAVLSNPREARFALSLQRTLARGDRRRKRILKEEGIVVPPFLICSIATACNLRCQGCYARSNGIADDAPTRPSLSAEQWSDLFTEAAQMGFSVALLAGGEPLTRLDVLRASASVKEMLFPVFTNGTLIGPQTLPLFKEHLNLLPIISLEGGPAATDSRRGEGVYQRALFGMRLLKEEGLFFGTSITVTTANKAAVTDPEFVQQLRELGCKIVFYVEYVPIDSSTAHLALSHEDNEQMELTVEQLRQQYADMLLVSFPGDEKLLDGCMAAGRGFFHIAPDGAAEPCPFSPHSDTNAARDGLRAALQSPLFSRIKSKSILQWEHTGGCTLHEHKEEVEALANASK